MSASREHRLVGLEPDNLLAFLALLGLLRALEIARPGWRPRVRWDTLNPPTRPILTLQENMAPASIAAAAAAGCDTLAKDHEFGEWKVPNGPQHEARRMLQLAIEQGPTYRPRADLLAALISDIVVKENEDAVVPTPLCLLFGQGHQYFLDRLSAVARQAEAPARGKGKKAVTLTPGETIERALFETWQRIDPSQSFRWDPEEDRRYALRFADPSKDTLLTVHGANRLAAVGMALLTSAPATTRGRVRLLTLGVRQMKGRTQISWPIWLRSTSLSGIRALLSHPLVSEDEPDRKRLLELGIPEIRRATRISAGKFLNFTRAVTL